MPHLLKNLELNGFKSFAQKVVLDFPEGITAIVGPNGSGKSNVVDAIRWLLGEREAKNLRGSKAEDLIFAGTPEKPKMSLAQASLSFENKNDFFPIDAAEINILRQVARDGTSQYFINKSEVRLKDLIDFFAKAKLGTKGLTIVSQGNSDVFIRATPKERREMIEEMLGLREFQIKKTRAENQLKNTQINLEKVRALIEEILPHLRSLRRQTGRWEKREILEAELREVENLFFGTQTNWLESKIKTVAEEISAHHTEYKTLEAKKIELERNQKEIEAGEPKERAELKKIKIQIDELLQTQIKFEKDISRFEAQLEMTERKMEPSLPAASNLFNFIKKIRVRLENILKNNLDDARVIVSELIKEIDSYSAAPDSSSSNSFSPNLKSQFTKVESDLKEIKTQIENLRDKEKTLEKSQGEFYESFKAAVLSVENIKSKIEEWDLKNQKIAFEKERLEIRLEDLKRQIIQIGRNPREFGDNINSGTLKELKQGLESPELREWEQRLFKLRGDLAVIGEIDHAILKEAQETESRYEFLKTELVDTEKAKEDLKDLISELSSKIKTEFNIALHDINKEFNNFFRSMFSGGHAKLKLTSKSSSSRANLKRQKSESSELIEIESNDSNENSIEIEPEEEEPGLEIDLSLPKKRLSSLEILSGGERSLVGIAALFSMISVSPPPFLVLDEIDAALDERNARRFSAMLKDFSKKTQFIIITHNRATMEVANILYGVTLNADGTSKIVSLRLESV